MHGIRSRRFESVESVAPQCGMVSSCSGLLSSCAWFVLPAQVINKISLMGGLPTSMEDANGRSR